MTLTFDGTIVVPVADPDDGERTARAVTPHVGTDAPVLLLYVVEKGGGAIDKTPREQQEEYAAEIFERARRPLAATNGAVETEIRYGTDTVETIFEAAGEVNADAVAFTAREGNRPAELLTGDVARRLVKEASVPVVALPQVTTREE